MQLLKHNIWLHCCLYLLCLWEKIDAVIHASSSTIAKKYNHLDTDFTIHKVSLTQKGYIQFLRYISDVPSLTDYTFCIWVKSNNLTYSHPLLSYSKHEEERLIRVWISPYGTHVNLEILELPIFSVPVDFVENHWYHVCQSWSSHQAAWNLYLNGKLKASGFVPKLRGIPIKPGGDIVVGQEYTDFDKGLDDGIEGDIFGFNFVLSPTSVSLKHPISSTKYINYPLRRHFEPTKIRPKFYPAKPLNIYNPLPATSASAYHNEQLFLKPYDTPLTVAEDEVPSVLSYFNVAPNRTPKGFLDIGKNLWNNLYDLFEPEVQGYYRHHPEKILVYPHHEVPFVTNRILNDIHDNSVGKPLGLKLVELGFNCGLGKGAPLSGKGVLISWTKTPVRVFGGAILKNIPPFCA